MKVRVAAILILLVFGAIRLPIEQKLTEEHRAAFFHGAKFDLDMRQRLGQGGFIAALSGFRSLVADILWLEAYSAWTRTEWGRMKLLFDTVTSLQPRNVIFWDESAWHMAWNASVAAYYDPKQPREALRIRAQREYFKIGEQYLLDGIKNNPDRWQLYIRLGALYSDKLRLNDPCKAHEAYEKCAALPGHPAFARRFAAYALADCPGHEREAYERLLKYYHMGKEERMPTLLTKLAELQEKLSVPPDQRIYTPPNP
ncbi:MAG TPA: hypothetical protein VFD27_06775 [Chthoniobacteraceae bacterium]|nr:hypothetical protein [Chthoniobacteraceae bacterium]